MTTTHSVPTAAWVKAIRVGIAGLLLFGSMPAQGQGDPPPPIHPRGPEATTNWLSGLADAATVSSPPPVGEAVQSAAGRLTFQSFRDGNWEIYAGSDDPYAGHARLTADPASDVEPRLSPDTRQVAFTSKRSGNYDLWLINADGSGLRQLTNDSADDSAPAWSPDGTRLAFTSSRGNNTDVYVLTLNGGAITRLTTQTGYDGEPAWSPDGTQIAFISKRSSGTYDYHLYTMAADGSAQTLRAAVPYASRPNWSPDGGRILFDGLNSGGWQRLYLYTASSGATQALDPSGIFAANYEVWAGGWGQGAQAYATLVSYILYEGTWYMEYTTLLTVDTVAGAASSLNSNRRDAMPDWRNADTLPPTTALAPADPYVPANVNGIGVGGTVVDQGIAGVDRVETQYRFANGDWQSSTLSCFLTLPSFGCIGMSPMQDVQIRARAVDRMGNAEAWPTNPNQWVTIHRYRLQVDGLVTDVRGQPLTHVPLVGAPTIDPNPATRGDGRYRLYVPDLPAPIVFTLPAALPGGATGRLRPYELEALTYGYGTSEALEDFTLRPTDQMLTDPSFDTGVGVWDAGDGLALQWLEAQDWPALPTRMRLGWEDRLRSLAASRMPPAIALTPDGGFVAIVADSTPSLAFVVCAADALCGTPLALGNGYPLALGLAADGTAAYLAQVGTDQVIARLRSPAGIWSDVVSFPTPVGSGYRIVADAGNAWHAVWTSPTNHVMLSHRNTDGTWTTPLDTGEGFYASPAVFDQDGRLHIPRCLSTGVNDMTWSAGEGLLGPIELSTLTCYNRSVWATNLADDGALYFVWNMGGDLKVRRRSPAGTITTITPVDYGQYDTVGVVAGQGGRPALVLQAWTGQALAVAQLTPSDTWDITPLEINHSDLYEVWSYLAWRQSVGRLIAIRMDVDRTPPLYTIGELALAGPGNTSVAREAVTLSNSLHRPLLALRYRQLDPATTLTVQIQAAPGGPGPLSQTLPSGSDWQRAWVDLSSYVGQAVTLTVSLDGPTGTWPLADFDEIVLGSWTTPLVTSISPALLEAPLGAVTLIGDNFIGTPTVSIGGVAATVTVVDAQHLSVVLPGGLGYGRHAVVVTNPDGFATTSPQTVQVGHDLLFIPALLRLIPGGWTTYFP